MTNQIHLLLHLLYGGAIYKVGLTINPDENLPPLPEHRLIDVWREEEVMKYLVDLLPSHYSDDHTIVGLEEISDILA